MNKFLRPTGLVRTFVFLLLALSAGHFSACRPAAGGEEPINEDTVKRHILPIEKAIQYTSDFVAAIDTLNKNVPHFADSMKFGHAESFPTDVFRELLRQSNDKQGKAMGIRIYYGRDNAGMIRLVMVPYDSLGNDIINHMVDINGKPVNGSSAPQVEALTVTSGGQTMQDGIRCPTVCDGGSSGLK